MIRLVCFFALIFHMSCSVAQPTMNYGTTNKKAIKLYEEGFACFNDINPLTGRRNLECAEEKGLAALEKDPNFREAFELLSNVYVGKNDIPKAIEFKEKMMGVSPRFSENEFYYLASMKMAIGDYEGCRKDAMRFLQVNNGNPVFYDNCKVYIANCDFALDQLKHPQPFEPLNLGKGVNTERPEYFPSLTADDQTLLFTRNIEDANALGGMGAQEDIFISTFNDSHWSEGLSLSKNINSIYNEGAPTFSADGKYVIFVGCEIGAKGEYDYGEGRQGLGSCDLFVSERVGNNWGKPFNMGKPINSHHWESQPCFSSDGKSLYFIRGIIRDRQRRDPGEQDIYITEIQENGQWSIPKKLNNNVNTPFREESVQIHPDGQTLYFSSNGHVGMGGLDIFMSRKESNGEWGKAVNLGYPINTYGDENSTLVSRKGDLAIFASNRAGGYGSLDLYSFQLPEAFRPFATTFMKGIVYDEETKKPLAADFQLINLKTKEIIKRAVANRGSGEFLVAIPKNNEFALIAEHDGYFFYSQNYSLEKLSKNDDGFFIDVPMRPLKGTFVLENVFFDVNKFDLKPESEVELEKLYKVLLENPSIKIELGGHTDSDGNDKDNQILSENRVLAVVNWLVNKGVVKERLTYKGYGESSPVAPNDTPENKAKNRRTEVKIL